MAAPPNPPSIPAPVPYWPAVIIKPDTVAGVRTYRINLILDMIFGGFALAIGIPSLLVVPSDLPSTVAFSAVLGAATCGLVIVFVINFIVSLMSVTKMHHGADEYGPQHARYARYGVAFKWIGTAVSTVAAILVIYLVFLGAFSFLLVAGQISPTVYVPLLVTVLWTAGVSCKGQMYRFMVRAIQPSPTQRWSDIAAVAIPVLGTVGIGVVAFATVRVIDSLLNPATISPLEAARFSQILIGGVFLPPGLSLAGYAIFAFVYARTSDQLAIGLGQVRGVMPQPGPWPWTIPPGYMVPPSAPAWTATQSRPQGSAPQADRAPATPAPPRTCPECLRPNQADARFCVHCGTRFAG